MVHWLLAAFIALVLMAGGASAQTETSDIVDPSRLRVCADPGAMPFSNTKGEGFENKIADLIAAELGIPVVYTWFPMATGFVRQTLRAGRCDLIMGYAQGDELVQNSNHYYRSAWTIAFKPGTGLDGLVNLDDPRLKDKRIGVIAGAPAADVMAVNGLMGKARPYQLITDRRYESPTEQMLAAVEKGEIDAGVAWGPISGYYARQLNPPLTVIPLIKETKGPRETYRITFGVRPHDQEWKRRLNRLIAKNQAKINAILLEYGVPLLDEQDQLITQ